MYDRYLRSLEEQIGPKPAWGWEDEWVPMMVEFHRLSGQHFGANEAYVRSRSMPEQKKQHQAARIDAVAGAGWPRERAELAVLLRSKARTERDRHA